MPLRTPRLRAFATAEPNGYVLAYDKIEGKSLDRLDPADLTDGVLSSIWHLIGQLRERRIAHRDLRLANIFMSRARTRGPVAVIPATVSTDPTDVRCPRRW